MLMLPPNPRSTSSPDYIIIRAYRVPQILLYRYIPVVIVGAERSRGRRDDHRPRRWKRDYHNKDSNGGSKSE